jgi:uncharacterized protein
MDNRKAAAAKCQRPIGFPYPDLKWLTEEEALLANRERNELIASLSDDVTHGFMHNKIHTGELSPGCLICGQGYWSCMFINGLCTAHCFYCPQDRNIKKERPPTEQGQIFDTPKDYVDYLEKFNIKGVGFSGGEPFLVFETLVTYITTIRERFGKGFYLWIYTNGDLVDKDKLRMLKDAGLDEIRFNISARDYDLQRVGLAIGIIDTVTIEIPSIPEDHETLKGCLKSMQKLGVKHLNIHQLLATQFNYKKYIDRGYTFLHHPNVPILESEMAALKLMRYAIDNNITLPINYCTAAYKDRLQGSGNRTRKALLLKEGCEEVTSSGYVRKISMQDAPANIKEIMKSLQERKCGSNSWSVNAAATELFMHGSLLEDVNATLYDVTIKYFEPQLKAGPGAAETGKEIVLNSNKKVFLRKQLVAQQKGLSTAALKSFQKLFIEKMHDKEVLSHFFKEYTLKTKESVREMNKEMDLLMSLKKWEHLETGFPKLY